MDQVILTDWEITASGGSHYSLNEMHKFHLENTFSMKIVSIDELRNDEHVVFYWGNKFRMPMLQNFPHLRWLHLGSSGHDNVKVAELFKSEVKMTTSKGFYSGYVAEYLLSVVLFSSKFPLETVFEKTKNNRYYIEKNNIFPTPLSDLNVLVFGTGEIATAFKDLMLKLNVDIECVSVSERTGFKSWKEIASGGTYTHVISLIALNEFTQSFFNNEIFSTICNGSIFINAGRGQTVDKQSLIAAINDGLLQAAVLDTHTDFNGSCGELSYCAHPKILCSPHVASWSNKFSELQFRFLKQQVEFYS